MNNPKWHNEMGSLRKMQVSRQVIVTNNANRILYVTVETEREFQSHKEHASRQSTELSTYNYNRGKSYDKTDQKQNIDSSSNSYSNSSSNSSKTNTDVHAQVSCLSFGASADVSVNTDRKQQSTNSGDNASYGNTSFIKIKDKDETSAEENESKIDTSSYSNVSSQWSMVDIGSGFTAIHPGISFPFSVELFGSKQRVFMSAFYVNDKGLVEYSCKHCPTCCYDIRFNTNNVNKLPMIDVSISLRNKDKDKTSKLFSGRAEISGFADVLVNWKLGEFIDAFRDQGFDEIEDWDNLIRDNGEILTNLIGMKPGHVFKFLRKYKIYQMEKQDKPLPVLLGMKIDDKDMKFKGDCSNIIRNQGKKINVVCNLKVIEAIRKNVNYYIDTCEVRLTLVCKPVFDRFLRNVNNKNSNTNEAKEDTNSNSNSNSNTGVITKTLTKKDLLQQDCMVKIVIDGTKLDPLLYYKVIPVISIYHNNKLKRSENYNDNCNHDNNYLITIEPRYMGWTYASNPAQMKIEKPLQNTVQFGKLEIRDKATSWALTNFVIRPNTGIHTIVLSCDSINQMSVSDCYFVIVGDDTPLTLNESSVLFKMLQNRKSDKYNGVTMVACFFSYSCTLHADGSTSNHEDKSYVWDKEWQGDDWCRPKEHAIFTIRLNTTHTQTMTGDMDCFYNGKSVGKIKNIFSVEGGRHGVRLLATSSDHDREYYRSTIMKITKYEQHQNE